MASAGTGNASGEMSWTTRAARAVSSSQFHGQGHHRDEPFPAVDERVGRSVLQLTDWPEIYSKDRREMAGLAGRGVGRCRAPAGPATVAERPDAHR